MVMTMGDGGNDNYGGGNHDRNGDHDGGRGRTMTAREIPGEYIIADGDITLNRGRDVTSVQVTNTGDRPVQIGSHAHFFETNRALSFDRQRAYGFHLNIPAGTSVRFEPGDSRTVSLVAYGGERTVYGFGGLVNGPLDQKRDEALRLAAERGYRSR